LWPLVVTGYDPHTDPQAFDRFCPDRNVAPDYPPTLLLHGDRDTDVPIELSRQMAAALQAQHVPHRLVTMEGMGHVFDTLPDDSLAGTPRGLKHPRVAAAFDRVLAFLNAQMDR
jgi:dipeptidyl aminopeptidase/acylaminoacyl peptidase